MAFPGIPDAAFEGYYKWSGCKTWYRITGDLDKAILPPIIVLHGGPGSSHSYTLQMANLANDERAVIHYDQIGCGNSTRLPQKAGDTLFWTVDLFLTELAGLLGHLKIDTYYVIGQSWGGYLGYAHALQQQKGLIGYIATNAIASYPMLIKGCLDWIEELAEPHKRNIQHAMSMSEYSTAEYKAAEEYFEAMHVCRRVPWPAEVQASQRIGQEDPTVYETLNGPAEFVVTGSLKDASLEDRLQEIKIPVLLLSGKYDEVRDWVVQRQQDRLPNSRWILYQDSAHNPFNEQPDNWLYDVAQWLEETSSRSSS